MKNNDKKYVTLTDGVDFRTIAKTMSENGYPMNHATARNILIQAMERLLNTVAQNMGLKLKQKHIKELIKDQSIHHALADVLYVAYNEKTNIEDLDGKEN
jgi:hypothetical protein